MAKAIVTTSVQYTGAISATQYNTSTLTVSDIVAADNITIPTGSTLLATDGIANPVFVQVKNTDLTSSISMSFDGGSTWKSKISPQSSVSAELLGATSGSIYLKADVNPTVISYVIC